ncbi:MAG: 30S ribosomal protein S19 [Candidatus Hodarchaeales archaeon]
MSSKRVFRYRGFTIDELRQKSMDEIISLLPARQRRSLRRGMPASHIRLFEKISKSVASGSKRPLRTHVRDFIILPNLVDLEVHVHNGREFLPVKIRPEMLGHFLGEFAPTCKIIKHSAPGVGATRSSQYVPLK